MAVKHDGGATGERFRFDFSGGRLCLDFANTLDDRPTEDRKEQLVDYPDLVSWARQAGVIGGEEAEALRGTGTRQPAEAQAVLTAARDLREALFDIFAAVAVGDTPLEGSLVTLNAALPEAMSALRVASVEGAFEWRWAGEWRGLDRPLLPVIRDAAELLTSPELSRVRLCESETCDWLFFDQSRNRTRRWCDMSTCGNRAKARRHYERRKHG